MAGTAPESVGSLEAALSHGTTLLVTRPDLAERQAEAILQVAPTDPRALMLLGAARRRRGDPAAARRILGPLARAQPRSADTHFELGMALAALGQRDDALVALRHAVNLKRDLPEAWQGLGDLLTETGDAEGADRAYAQQIRASVSNPNLIAAADAMCDDRLAVAERLLRHHIKANPSDVAALRMLAETGTRLGRYGDAEALLERCLELSPSFTAARYNYAIVLYRQQKAAPAIRQIELLLADHPTEANYRNLLGAALSLVGDYQRAIAVYGEVLADHPHQPRIWLSFGHVLKTAGRRAEAIGAYERCLTLAPSVGEAYWSLANLKTAPFSDEQTVAMTALLARDDLTTDDRFHLCFALGKAREDADDHAAAFACYAAGAALRRQDLAYDADETSAQTGATINLFTRPFLDARSDGGALSDAPIFILGLPRSGSTLIEQILASHSAVEGTMELPQMVAIARDLGRSARLGGAGGYPVVLADLTAAERTALGERYLEETGDYRRSSRPVFIDKMPNNFHHIGLIRLILPNARIIDARRHPMAAGFSAFKQHFARGQAFSYDLADLGRYYRDYLALMRHFDAVAPGAVHRVIYEDMVEDTEGEVRRLLDYCGLTFEPACLRFHDNQRAVRTASSEQVRRPIYREGLDQWRRYEPWLGPLKAALGDALETWRC